MMEIVLNGQQRQVPEHTSAQELLELLGLAQQRIALEVNQEIVPRSTFSRHSLRAGDRVEIVRAIGGG